MRIDIDYDPASLKASLPVARSVLAASCRLAAKALAKEPEISETLELLGGRPGCVGLLVCGDEQIRDYNRRFRKMDRATDVLSFPTREIAHEPSLLAIDATDRSLGDLVISLATVERAARRARRPVEHEFLEVFLHGVLHLWGYDHVKVPKVQADHMRALQRRLFLEARRLI